jgi:hypothetical protein
LEVEVSAAATIRPISSLQLGKPEEKVEVCSGLCSRRAEDERRGVEKESGKELGDFPSWSGGQTAGVGSRADLESQMENHQPKSKCPLPFSVLGKLFRNCEIYNYFKQN